MNVYQPVKNLVIHLRFHHNENLLRFSRRRKLDDVLTTSHIRRTPARENFNSARRRGVISLSMLKFPCLSLVGRSSKFLLGQECLLGLCLL